MMPNWCENVLIVTGDEPTIAEFKHVAKGEGTDLSLNNLYPMPKELEETRAPADKPNWYDWRCDNWGTKWDVQAVLIEDSGTRLRYEFDSAWVPPLAWLSYVAGKYPQLRFVLRYEEEGCGFFGKAVAEEGEVTQDLFTD